MVYTVPPSGGSLEIGNTTHLGGVRWVHIVPPSGGSLEIGNEELFRRKHSKTSLFPLRGDP